MQELLDAKLKSGEQSELETELDKLSNVEFIKESLLQATAIASNEQAGALQNLKEIKSALQKISNLSPEYNQLSERMSSLIIEFDDVTDEISQYYERLIDDPEQLELINQKLQLIYTLQKKHTQVSTVEELLTIQKELDNKAQQSDDIEAAIEKLKIDVDNSKALIDKTAVLLSEKRTKKLYLFLLIKLPLYYLNWVCQMHDFNFQCKHTEITIQMVKIALVTFLGKQRNRFWDA